MTYIFDTSSFVQLKHYYPSTFPTVWAELDRMVAEGAIWSVREALRELDSYTESDLVQDWAKGHKQIFETPTSDELLVVRQILAVPHFQTTISQQALLKGRPVADPFVVAAGKSKNATVVTQERPKPNATKIPNICGYFAVPCISLEQFMLSQGWSF